jgi:hypothetical protein
MWTFRHLEVSNPLPRKGTETGEKGGRMKIEEEEIKIKNEKIYNCCNNGN